MKKVLSLLLCLVVAVSCLGVCAFAAGSGSLVVSVDNPNAQVGDTVTVTVSLTNSTDVKMLQFDVSLPSGLTYVSGSGAINSSFAATTGIPIASFNESNMRVGAYGAVTGYSGGSVAVLTFKCTVAEAGTWNIGLIGAVVGDSDTPGVTQGTVTTPVATPEPTAEPTATPEPTVEPTATPEPTVEPTAEPDPTEAPEETTQPTAKPDSGKDDGKVKSPKTGYGTMTVMGIGILVFAAAAVIVIMSSKKKSSK